MWCYTFELRKRNFFAKLQTKVQKPMWKEKKSLLWNYLCTYQTNTNKNSDGAVEKTEYDSLLTAKSSFNVALQSFSLQEQTSSSSVIN